MDKNNTSVSIACITYNHERFISKAIDSFLSQKVKFNYEIIIGVDYCSDKTKEICLEYRKNYPDKIKLLLHETNVGMMANFNETLSACKSKYIAVCEGDDYWVDDNKLQKQFDFMEKNEEYILCYHNAEVLFENNSIKSRLFNKESKDFTPTLRNLVFAKWFIPTASIFFRNVIRSYPSWFTKVKNGDLALELLLFKYGPFFYSDEVMSIYRRHEESVSEKFKFDKIYLYDSLVYLFENIKNEYDKKFHDIFDGRIKELNNEKNWLLWIKKYPIVKKLYTLRNIIFNK